MEAHALPDKNTIIQNIKKNLPEELLKKPVWLAYYFKKKKDGTYSKPPCTNKGYSVDDNFSGVPFEQACKDGYPGIKISKSNPLIAFDVDDTEAKLGKRPFELGNLSKEFKSFLAQNKSYAEYSPSKCGLRILFFCEDKASLPGRANLNKDLCIGGELYLSSGYVTITGDTLVNSQIKTLQPHEFSPWYGSKETPPNNVIPIKPQFKSNIPSISLFKEALNSCALDQNARVTKTYKTITGQDYLHYEYWMRIMTACHHYASESGLHNDVLTAVVNWSQTDPTSFDSDDDVVKHWSSLQPTKGITYHTLFKFAKLLKFAWPQEAFDKNGNSTGKPLVNSVENFEYLMEYFSLKFFQDIFDGSIYIKGDADIVNRYFLSHVNKRTFFGMVGPFTQEEIKGITWQLAQNNHYLNVTYSTISPLIKHYLTKFTKPMNMLKLWLETDPNELSEDMVEYDTDLEKSNLDYLMSCITFHPLQNMKLAKKYFETFFFEMVMPLYNSKRQYSQRSFMLVLTGPEACRKTTFFSMLFPPNMRRQFVTNSTETLGGAKSIRDFSTSLVNSALVVTDEFEIFYNQKNDSLFKTYVTSDVIDYVPIYEKTMRKEYKNAVLAGTTNKRSLPFEQDSNRRLAMIDVKFIDTSAMECINWHHFYREYVRRGHEAMKKGIHPWKLSRETILLQYEANEQFRAKSNLEIIFYEIFDFEFRMHKEVKNYDNGKGIQSNKDLMSLKDVMGIVKQRYPELKLKPAETKHLLKRLCGKYTKTTNTAKLLQRGKGSIENGLITQGQYTRYVMPPILTDFE